MQGEGLAAGAQPLTGPGVSCCPRHGTLLGAPAQHPSSCPTFIPLSHGCIQCPAVLCVGARLGNGRSHPKQALASLLCPCSGAKRSIPAGACRRAKALLVPAMVSTSSTAQALLELLNPDMSQPSDAQVSLLAALNQAAASGENAKRGTKSRG